MMIHVDKARWILIWYVLICIALVGVSFVDVESNEKELSEHHSSLHYNVSAQFLVCCDKNISYYIVQDQKLFK